MKGVNKALMQGDNERSMSFREYLKFEQWINYVTIVCILKNLNAEIKTYNVKNEEDLREKQNERLDESWIKILD